MKICALITDGVVVNVIVLGNEDEVAQAAAVLGADLGVDVTDWQPHRPGIGYTWDGATFTPPPAPEPEPEPEPEA